MSVTTDIEAAVMEILEDYSGDVQEAVVSTVTGVTRQAARMLRKSSPERTGDYAKGWRGSIENTRTQVRGTVHNVKKPQIAHLLEKGHGPGKRGWRVDAIPHIGPVEAWASEEAVRRLRERL